MHFAAQAGHIGMITALLAAGDDLGARYGTCQMSALEVAARFGRAGVAKMLIGHGVNVNMTDADVLTPLHHAAWGGSAQVIDSLAKAGAKIDKKNVQRDTPLHFAASLCHLEAALALLRHGAQVNVTNEHRQTPCIRQRRILKGTMPWRW